METETQYRKEVQKIYQRLENALSEVDPDIVECMSHQGSMKLIFSNESQCILSTQPSLCQLWLVVSSQGRAYHFSYHPETKAWVDEDRELMTLLKRIIKQETGLMISW